MIRRVAFPLLLLTALGLHVDSAVFLARRTGRCRTWERPLFAGHVVGYLAVVFVVLSPVKAVVFVVVQQGCWGYTRASRSRPITRACRSWPPTTPATSCTGRS